MRSSGYGIFLVVDVRHTISCQSGMDAGILSPYTTKDSSVIDDVETAASVRRVLASYLNERMTTTVE